MTDSTKKKEDHLTDYAKTVAENIEKLIDHQTNKKPKIKTDIDVMLLNLGRMLSTLPEDTVERLNLLIYKAQTEVIRFSQCRFF